MPRSFLGVFTPHIWHFHLSRSKTFIGSTVSTRTPRNLAFSFLRRRLFPFRLAHDFEQYIDRFSPYNGENALEHSAHGRIDLSTLSLATLLANALILSALSRQKSEHLLFCAFFVVKRSPQTSQKSLWTIKDAGLDGRKTSNAAIPEVPLHVFEQNLGGNLSFLIFLNVIPQNSQTRSGALAKRRSFSPA
ncbi:hypothetical protein [Rhizobium sp. S9]|uniref:hypothetical protein n=1 Tax=Rhizobium sp. S9 TaxID=2035454 RepID=UPI001AEF61BE|nr:hypothetical protein [Rhizobium sp. S9]